MLHSMPGDLHDGDRTIISRVVAPVSLTHVTSRYQNRPPEPDRLADPTGTGRLGGGSADRGLADIQAVEVISRAVVMLMSAAAEQLGLSDPDPEHPAHRDLDEARTLITALAGLVSASVADLGPHAAAFRDGLAALQGAFREYSAVPDEPGQGPGEGRRSVS